MSDEPVWRFGTAERDGRPYTVLEVEGRLYAFESLLGRDVPVLDLLERWEHWRPVLARLAGTAERAPDLGGEALDWLPPVLHPRKLVCAGANYRDHLDEMNADFDPGFPRAFLKPTTTGLIGSGRPVTLPDNARLVDWEAELAVVIGRRAKHLRGADVMTAVAGYTAFNDLSARDWNDQALPMVGMDLVIQKGFDDFGPIGPLITPPEHVGDPQTLDMELTVNGAVKQSANTSNMLFGVREILEHFMAFMTLEPGDVIATGSPAGVGYARRPQEFLAGGDVVVVTIERLGRPLVTPMAPRPSEVSQSRPRPTGDHRCP